MATAAPSWPYSHAFAPNRNKARACFPWHHLPAQATRRLAAGTARKTTQHGAWPAIKASPHRAPGGSDSKVKGMGAGRTQAVPLLELVRLA